MIRKIIQIDEAKCNGCGACAHACQEGAIGMVNGRAKLLRDDYCDGLGNCLPACPTDAITFIEREAAAYDEQAVRASRSGCAGSRPSVLSAGPDVPLSQWPVQMRLVPISAPFFQQADLLIAADCTAYACSRFHTQFMQNKITLIGCPKLDETDYAEKLTEILRRNEIRSLHVARMEVPCCGGIERAVRSARQQCGKPLPLRVTVLSLQGDTLSDTTL